MSFKKYFIRKILSIPFLGDCIRYYGATNYKLSRYIQKIKKIINQNNINSIVIEQDKTLVTSKNNFKILHHIQSIVANKGDTSTKEITLISKILKQSKKNELVVFDVGANIGEYSINLAKENKKCIFYCFEPMPLYYRLLKENIILNKVQSQFEAFQFALSNVKGIGWLSKKIERVKVVADNSRIVPPPPQVEKVELISIDDFMKLYSVKSLDFIKIDVEGNEYRVLEGAKETLKKYKPTLFLELDKEWLKRSNCTPQDIFDFLLAIGYKSFYVINEKGINYVSDKAKNYISKLGIENDLLCFYDAKVSL